jgi:hypothetical protein
MNTSSSAPFSISSQAKHTSFALIAVSSIPTDVVSAIVRKMWSENGRVAIPKGCVRAAVNFLIQ